MGFSGIYKKMVHEKKVISVTHRISTPIKMANTHPHKCILTDCVIYHFCS